MATAGGAHGQVWISWLMLMPLFIAIRAWRPAPAAIGAASWAFSLYAFSPDSVPAVSLSAAWSLLLLTAIPAVYAYLGSKLTRAIGFSPFVLAVAWMGVELAAQPIGFRAGVLAVAAPEGSALAWAGQGLGYILVTFLVALVGASLVSVLSAARRLRTPWCRFRSSVPDAVLGLSAQTSIPLQTFPVSPSQPRAPPVAC